MLPKNYKYELPDLHVWLQEHGKDLKITSKFDDHKMFEGFLGYYNKLPPTLVRMMRELISQHQLKISGPMGTVSAIQGGCSMGAIEIYCLEGDIFDDIRRYGSVEEAGKTILSLLTTGMFDETVAKEFYVFDFDPEPTQKTKMPEFDSDLHFDSDEEWKKLDGEEDKEEDQEEEN